MGNTMSEKSKYVRQQEISFQGHLKRFPEILFEFIYGDYAIYAHSYIQDTQKKKTFGQ